MRKGPTESASLFSVGKKKGEMIKICGLL